MKFQFWTIGRDHEKYVEPGITDFTRRISYYYPVNWKIIPGPRNAGLLTEQDLKRKESESILKLLTPQDYLILLDEHGKQLSSEQLAEFIRQRANESAKSLVFLIGGAFGVDESLLQRANFTLSFSLLTFPHQLVRLILSEQVYRACTIIRNEKYHHQ